MKKRGKPGYLVSCTLYSDSLKQPIQYKIQVYGYFKNPWLAQEAASRKWFHVCRHGTQEQRTRHKFRWGQRLEIDPPRPLGMKIDPDEWGI